MYNSACLSNASLLLPLNRKPASYMFGAAMLLYIQHFSWEQKLVRYYHTTYELATLSVTSFAALVRTPGVFLLQRGER
jgi:hypothetical protein